MVDINLASKIQGHMVESEEILPSYKQPSSPTRNAETVRFVIVNHQNNKMKLKSLI